MATAAQPTSQPNSSGHSEIDELIDQINQAPLSEDLRGRLINMTGRLALAVKMGGYSSEYENVKKYVDWVVSIPWDKYTQDNLDIKQVSDVLEKSHYGLQPVKDHVTEYISVMILQREKRTTIVDQAEGSTEEKMKKLRGSSANAPIMSFVGVQGVGKTSMAKAIASALNRKFIRISLGALGGATELRGRSRGENDAEPGKIIKALVKTKVMNPLILLDEIDKVSGQEGLRADVMAALLEILDPEQNATFVDHYLDYPVDLSKVIFITTANNLGGVSTALLDRLEVIRFSSYSPEDKKMIAKNYLLPKVRQSTGLTEAQLEFDDDVWDIIISPLGFDAGVRQLERNLTKVARKVAKRIVQGIGDKVIITPENFREFIPQDIEIYS